MADAIEKCARKFAKTINDGAEAEAILSIAELVRLLPLLKDLRTEEPLKGINVRWINAQKPDTKT